MIRIVMLYLLSSLFLVHAGESLVVESNGCVMKAKHATGFSFMKTDEGVSFIKYKYKDGRIENIKIRCKDMALESAISSDYVQEKDGLKFGSGSHPLAKAERISGENWSGVQATYFLGSVCFTTSFEAGKTHVFSIGVCGEEEDMKELRSSFLVLLKHANTHYAESDFKQ